MTLAPGTTIGRYQILEPLGQGGMATVYKAFQPSLQREVALKVLRPGYSQDAEFKERFEREAIAIAKLRHPNIVQVFDFELTDGHYALAMEFLEGGTLKERLGQLASTGRGIDAKDAVRIVWEVADALSYAHEGGIVHRDVKPSNVMLAAPRERAVVTDFGIARILGATSHTQTGVGIGTPQYMAPEQGQGGAIDHRADIYSLGAMAYEMLVGRVPYVADTPLAVVLAHMKDPLPLPSSVNPTIGKAVERALLKALAKDREQRYASATDFAEALKDALAEDMRGGTVPTIVARGAAAPLAAPSIAISLPRALARRPIALGVAGALLVAVVGGGLVATSALRSTPGATPAAAQPTAATAAMSAPTATPTTLPQPTLTPSEAARTASPPPAVLPALTPLPVTPPKFAIPAKGRLLFDARLDGTAGDLVGLPTKTGDASGTDYRLLPDALELSVLKDARPPELLYVSAAWNRSSLDTYVVEYELAFAPGSRSEFTILLRYDPQRGANRLRLDLAARQIYVTFASYAGGIVTAPETLSPVVPLGTTADGRTITLAIVVEAARFIVYIDQKEVLRTADARIERSSMIPTFDLGYGIGTVRITGARFYELPRG